MFNPIRLSALANLDLHCIYSCNYLQAACSSKVTRPSRTNEKYIFRKSIWSRSRVTFDLPDSLLVLALEVLCMLLRVKLAALLFSLSV